MGTRSSSWFAELFGFVEADYDKTQARLHLDGTTLRTDSTDEAFAIGRFSRPRLAELRLECEALNQSAPSTIRHEVIGDVLEVHARPEHRGATFQVASQFNCLEFMGPRVTPEEGITHYASDPTQGPACALAAAPATAYRNYLVPVGDRIGQRADAQLDNLDALAAALADEGPLWEVTNGYTFATPEQLGRLARVIASRSIDDLRGEVRIGIHTQAQVVFASRFRRAQPGQRVSQTFCSALSCAYTAVARPLWEPFARLVLEAAYEGTLRSAALERARGEGSGRVWLTFLGGGAFGNDPRWIEDAIVHAALRTSTLGLDIRVAHFRSIDPSAQHAIDRGVASALTS